MFALTVLAAASAPAADCTAILQGHADWLEAPSNEGRTLWLEIVSSELRFPILATTQQQKATFAEGDLAVSPGGTALGGGTTRYFSNRRLCSDSWCLNSHPFNHNQTSPLNVSIAIASAQAALSQPGTSWTDSVTLQCENGVMYGFGKATQFVSGRPLYALTLKRVATAIPE
jgi:hypothetical protein